MLATDDLILGSVQPKSFTTYVSPTNASQQSVHFADAPSPKPSLTKSKSKSLGLSLRRITPQKSTKELVASPNNESNNGGNGSFVSRLTGRSKRDLSVNATGANLVSPSAAAAVTPPRSQRSPSRSPGGRRAASIEKRQKMQDEYYYAPAMHWADENEGAVTTIDDDDEMIEDGDLPSLKRASSHGSRRSWRAAALNNGTAVGGGDIDGNDASEYYDEEGRRFVPLSPPMEHPSRAAAVAAAAAAALAAPAELTRAVPGVTPEQLKVAGFWSQFDDNGTFETEDNDKPNDGGGGNNGDNDNGDDDDSEDAPGDERNWRRSQSPPRNRNKAGTRGPGRKVGFVDEIYNDDTKDGDSTIGLDLIPMSRYGENADADDDDDTIARKRRQRVQDREALKEEQKQANKSKQQDGWNLLEKAACFNAGNNNNNESNDNADDGGEEYGTDPNNTSRNSNASNSRYNTSRNTTVDQTYEDDEDQSLDRTYDQTHDSRTAMTGTSTNRSGTATGYSAGGTNSRTRTTIEEEEDDAGVLACITVALSTMCGYDPAANTGSNNSHSSSKRKARARAMASNGSYDSDDLSAYLYEEEDSMEEDAAIELQYQIPDSALMATASANGPGSIASSNWSQSQPGTKKKKKKGLRKFMSFKKSKKNVVSGNASVASSPGNRSRGHAHASPPRKTLVTTTTRSGAEPVQGEKSRVTDYLTSMTFEQELGLEEDDTRPPNSPNGQDGQLSVGSQDELEQALGDRDPPTNDDSLNDETTEDTKNTGAMPMSAAAAAAAMAAAAMANRDGEYDDDEELQSEAAAWSTNKKNSYLRQLAERAKMEYATKAGSSSAAASGDGTSEDDDGNATAGSSGSGLGAVGAAALMGVAALVASQSNITRDDTVDDTIVTEQASQNDDDQNTMEESTIGSITKYDAEAQQQSSNYTADYQSFSPTEKRQFLRLLNGGMSPQDAAASIAGERNGGAMEDNGEASIDEEEDEEQEGDYEYDGEPTMEDEYEENDDAYVTDELGEGPVSRSAAYPMDESMPSLVSQDPPGNDVLRGMASGESAELLLNATATSGNDDANYGEHSAGLDAVSQQENNNNKASSMAKSAALAVVAVAALPLVAAAAPIAIVRAKSRRAKSSKLLAAQLLEEDVVVQESRAMPQEDKEEERPTQTSMLVVSQEGGGRSSPKLTADGLLSSGIGYYDAIDPSEKDGEIENDDSDHYDSGLLDAPAANRGRSRKGKLLGAAVASGLAAKAIASRQRSGEGGKDRGSKYVSAPASPNYDESSGAVSPRSAVSGSGALSPRSLSSPSSPRNYDEDAKSDFTAKSGNKTFLNFMKKKKINRKDKFSKLDSDTALDQVAPSMSLEVEGTPSWLLPRDDEMDDEVVGRGDEVRDDEEVLDGDDNDGAFLGVAAVATVAAVGVAAVDIAASRTALSEEEEEFDEEEESDEEDAEGEAPQPPASSYSPEATYRGDQYSSPPISAGKSSRNIITPNSAYSTPGHDEDDVDDGQYDDDYDDNISPQGSAFVSPQEFSRSVVASPQESQGESLALSPDGSLEESLVLSPGSAALSPRSPFDEPPDDEDYEDEHEDDYSEAEEEEGDDVEEEVDAYDEQQEEYYEDEEDQYEDEKDQYEDEDDQYAKHGQDEEVNVPTMSSRAIGFPSSPVKSQSEAPAWSTMPELQAVAPPELPATANTSVDNDDRSYISEYTYATNFTTASKSQRKRHKGAASKRMQQAKEAKSNAYGMNASNKGWLGSIRDAASSRGQVWDPEVGWVDYTEPEVSHEPLEHDFGAIGSLRIPTSPKRRSAAPEPAGHNLTVTTVAETEAEQQDDASRVRKPVDFPAEWANERTTMINNEKSTYALPSSTAETDESNMKYPPDISQDDDSVFDTMTVNTVNTAAEASIYSTSSAAPTKRSRARHRPTDRRKLHQQQQQQEEQHKSKTIGWKESMQNATSAVGNDGTGRHWDYERGWIKADGSVDDDVSVLTKSTLEFGNRSPVDGGETSHVERSKILAGVSSKNVVAASQSIGQYDAGSVVGEDSVALTHLPSVMEDRLDDDSTTESADEANAAPVAIAAAAAAVTTHRSRPKHRPTDSRNALLDDTASTISEATDNDSDALVAAASVPTRRSGSRHRPTDSRKVGSVDPTADGAHSQDLENDVNVIEAAATQESEDAVEGPRSYISPETGSEDETEDLSSNDVLDPPTEHVTMQQGIGVPSLKTMGSGNSDKENQESDEVSSRTQSQRQYSQSQKPPLPATKRSLNSWLENANHNALKPLDESEDAIMTDSRDSASASIRLNESKGSSASPNSKNFRLSQENLACYSPIIDPFKDSFNEGEVQRSEVQVVKEHISDADSDLFELPKTSNSFNNRIKESLTRKNIDSKEILPVMESFGSENSSRSEVQEVKEHLSDADSDLFELPNTSDSFNNRIKKSLARKNIDSREILPVMESFESENSSDSTSWIPNPPSPIREEPSVMSEDQSWAPGPPSPIKEERSVMSERSGMSGDRSLSSRAQAWMTSVEKRTQQDTIGEDKSQMDNSQMDSDVPQGNKIAVAPLARTSPRGDTSIYATSDASSHNAPRVNRTATLASPGESALFSSLSPGESAVSQNTGHAPSQAGSQAASRAPGYALSHTTSYATSYATSNATSQKSDTQGSSTSSSYIGTRNAKKAADSWIRAKKIQAKAEERQSSSVASSNAARNLATSPRSATSNSWLRAKKDLETDEQQSDTTHSRQTTQKQSNAGGPRTMGNSWIHVKKDQEEENAKAKNDEQQNYVAATPSQVRSTSNLRSKFENKDSKSLVSDVESDEIATKPVFVPAVNPKENDVYFRSTAMGIRLKRGEDGVVRVVSVTEAIPGSSIVRDGAIEPEDMILEAAGVDLRKPISNSQWGETVTKIRNAPRPMKFVVTGGPNRKEEEAAEEVVQESDVLPPAKFVMESRLSKSPEGQQVLQSLSEARSHRQGATSANKAPPTPSDVQYGNVGRRDEDKAASSLRHEEGQQQPPQKESFFRRMAACASPANAAAACVSPTRSATNSYASNNQQQHQGSSKGEDDGSHVPMAHLQFLRTNPTIARVTSNPTIARVTNAASRRYPAFCGRPDTIFEEPDDDDRTKASRTAERSLRNSNRQPYGMSRSRSGASSTYGGSQSYADSQTMSTYDGTKVTTYSEPRSTTSSGGSTGSGGTGDNTAFLEKLALNSAVASKTMRPPYGNEATASNTMAIANKLGKPYSMGQNPPHSAAQEDNNELGWPDDGDDQRQNHAKDTINSTSAYSSSYQSNKKDTTRQAEFHAAAKVEDMMNELHNVDPDDQCEI